MDNPRIADAVEHISKYLTESQVTYKESYYILEAIKSKIEADMLTYLGSKPDFMNDYVVSDGECCD